MNRLRRFGDMTPQSGRMDMTPKGAVSGLPSPSATVKESMDFFDGVSQASLQRETFPVAVTYVTRVNRL